MVNYEHIVGEPIDDPADGIRLEQLQRTPYQLPQHILVQLGARTGSDDLPMKQRCTGCAIGFETLTDFVCLASSDLEALSLVRSLAARQHAKI